MPRRRQRSATSPAASSRVRVASSVCSAPTLALKSAHKGLSAPPSNGAPVMTLRASEATYRNTNFGGRMPRRSDSSAIAIAWSTRSATPRRRET